MVIPMQHIRHGRKVAIDELEAIADEKAGWVRIVSDVPAPTVEKTEKDAVANKWAHSYGKAAKATRNNRGVMQ